ncbi:MAG: hypothetical protein M1827_000167 [Pycnora praestabilis]|nr:MAG: hypothetical protein M1827_000167 [Pycnora praestabilis]
MSTNDQQNSSVIPASTKLRQLLSTLGKMQIYPGCCPLALTPREMGFKIMIFHFAALAPAYTAIKGALEKLEKEGIMGTGKELTPKMLFEVCGLSESMEIDARAEGKAFEKDV